MTPEIGSLFIISTPIGNLGDITYRAIEILRSVPLVAAEDTRHTRKLFSHYGISTPLISYYEHNEFSRIPKIVAHLNSGQDLGVVADAGTPGISDPAYRLVREAIAIGSKVESIPGPSAVLAALVLSGLPTDRFIFEGFLPRKKGRKMRMMNLRSETATVIIFENKVRLIKTLHDLLELLGERPAVVARELTKLHEEIIRGTLTDCIEYFSSNPPKGECIILVGKNDSNVYFK